MRSISVTGVVLGKMANLDAECGRMSPVHPSPLRRNISEMCSSRHAVGIAVDEKHRPLLVALSLSWPPKSYGLDSHRGDAA